MNTSNKRKHDETIASDEEDFHDESGTIVEGIYIPPPIPPICSFDPLGPRLVITQIHNHYFKSYGPSTILGPFHKCFNAIVGPNGSGKSNVIDAMLFVFGYRATKIRSKKTSVLIHNSDQFRNLASCTVKVHFAQIIDKGDDDYDIVPGSEFSVSRTANKDNSSYYQLNGSKVQFKEISQLLKKHGIDLNHNRFLILQGEVEQIAMMKCKAESEHQTGMLEYLEDVIGTTRYKKPLEQLNDKVDIYNEKRNQQLNRLHICETELEQLRGPMKEAVNFLEIENEGIKYKNILYQYNIYSLNMEIKEFVGKKEKIEKKHQNLVDELADIVRKREEKEAFLREKSSNYDELHKRQAKLEEAFDKANKRDIELQADMTQMLKDRKKCKESLTEERKKLEQLSSVPAKNQASIEEIEKREDQLATEREQIQDEKKRVLASLRTETEHLQERKEGMQKDLAVLKKTVDETKSAFTLAQSELELCTSNEEREKTKLIHLKEALESVKEKKKLREEERTELERKIPQRESQLRDIMKEIQIVNKEEPRLVKEVHKQRMSLEEVRSSMQASRSSGKVLDSLMREKRSGNCPGLYGRLGDLGAIDLKYDVAISTACGRLDNIVVDTVATAQWCIEYLKKYNIGRATFIALDKQEHLRQQADSRINTPENVARLYDLIRVQNEDVRTAFYYALRDTLVAEDVDQATRIAFGEQRFRVVTLKGDLIEITGTMSGGGRTVMRGKMGQSVATTNINPKEVEKMETDLNVVEEQLRSLRQKQTTLEEQTNLIQPELHQMKQNLQKFQLELEALRQQQPQLVQQIKEQEVKCKTTKTDPVQMKKLQKIVDEKKAIYEEAQQGTVGLQEEVDKLTKLIKEKTSGKMSVVENKLQKVLTTIDKCKADVTRLRVGIKTAERNYKKSEEKIATMEQSIETMENNLRKMKAEREEIEEDVRKMLDRIKEIAETLNAASGEHGGVKAEVTELKKIENKLKSEKVDVDEQVKTARKKMSDLEKSVQQYTNSLKNLKLEEIPEQNQEPLQTFTIEELQEMDIGNVERDLQKSKHFLETNKPNLNVLNEYKEKKRLYTEKSMELDKISEKRNMLKNLCENLVQQRKEEFLLGYSTIKLKLKETYQMITLGGDADFEMIDTFDPFTQGIQFKVRPPKKSWKNISNLSGGERTLSSLALVFALHYYKPSPLYVMDEIDAALDFKNVSIVASYIKERTKNAQFIIISLRNNMFELCDNLVGIYKTNNTTKTITIDPRGFNDESVVVNGNETAEPSEKEAANTSKSRSAATQAHEEIEITIIGPDEVPSAASNGNEKVLEERCSLEKSNVSRERTSSSCSEIIDDSFEPAASMDFDD